MPIAMLDPTTQPSGPDARLAPRDGQLKGKRLGLVKNGKHKSAELLVDVLEVLRDELQPIEVHSFTVSAARPASDDELDRIAELCDVVVHAVGDCGSCSAACVANVIDLEKRGVIAAGICTSALRASADAMARLQGFPGYRYAVVQHPLSTLDASGVRDRAHEAAPQLLEIFRGVE